MSFQIVMEVGGDLEWEKGPGADFQNFRSRNKEIEILSQKASHGLCEFVLQN